MKYLNKTFLLLVCLIMLISVGGVSAADDLDNQTLHDTDNEITTNNQAKSCQDLQDQINEKNEGDTLTLEDDYDCSEIIDSVVHYKEVKINKSITIEGKNHNKIIKAKINITSGEVVMKNLVFEECNGGIFAKNSKLTIMDCTFENYNKDSNYMLQGDDLKIINATFLKVIMPIGNSKNVIIINSTCDRCPDKTYFDGITSLKISNSEFKNNIDVIISADEADISNSSFTKNKNICLNFRNSIITDCEFIDNFDSYISTEDYTPNRLIYLEGNATLSGNTFLNNSYWVAVYFAPEKNVLSHFNMVNNVFMSQYSNGEYLLDYNFINPLTYSAVNINPSTKTIHVIPKDEDDYYYYDETVSTISIKNNYFGFNIEDLLEFNLNKLIFINRGVLKSNLVNLYLEKGNANYTLNFVNDDKNIVKLPNSTFSIIDRESGDIIVSNISVVNGKGTFEYDGELSQDSVYIVNSLNQIVNKPKAIMTFAKYGSDYFDVRADVKLENGTGPIGNEAIFVIITQHRKTGGKSTFSYRVNTRADGTQTADGRADDKGSYYVGPIMNYWNAESYSIKIIFSDKDFGTTIGTFDFKVNQIDTVLTLKSSAKEYNPKSFRLSSMSQLSPVSWTSPKYGKIEMGTLQYKIYKGTKLVYKTVLSVNDGKIKPRGGIMPVLSVGTYKVVVESDQSVYKVVKKTTTLKIKPAKTTVKALKVSNKYKASKYFKVIVKLKGKAVKNVKINLKIFTGKKSKNYVVKTNKNGLAKFNTKNLKIGKHRTVIKSKDRNYIINAKSQITIKR